MPSVLVVDDDENLRTIYKKNLEYRGYKVETAIHGADALDKISEQKPDIVILDIMMPELDGVKVLENLKEKSILDTVSVIMLTGVSEINLMKKCLDLGAKGYILKGASMEEIDKRLKMLDT
ncbi:MAG: response regulator transcription factor [Thermodesulfobacteriota bacterium]